MTVETAKQQYQNAVELYHHGKWEESLRLLDELARDRPDSRHIIYYRALCMAALDRIEDANDRIVELSSFKDESSKELMQRLNSKLKPQLKAFHKEQAIKKALKEMPLESDSHYEEPAKKGWHRYAFIAVIAVPCVLAAIIFSNLTEKQSEGTTNEPVAAGPGSPDQFLEISSFLTSKMEKPLDFIVCMTPAGGITQRPDAELNANVGQHLLANWREMQPTLQTALRMASGSSDLLGGIPRSEMMTTLVLPRQDTPAGEFQGVGIQTYRPGMATTLQSLTATVGEPDKNESWTGAARGAGIYGKTYWWRNVGVAVDGAGYITHVLLRGYPVEG
jgi:hypothetical protein